MTDIRTRRMLGLVLLGTAALVAACAEEDESARRNQGSSGDNGGEHGPSNVGEPPMGEESANALPRLSRDEYIATVTDILAEALPMASKSIVPGVVTAAAALPEDLLVAPPNEKHGGFSRLDQSQQQGYADVPYRIAAQLGKDVTSPPARLGELVGACSNNGTSIDRPCLESFVKRFGELVHRRPLSDEDVAFYTANAPATNVPAAFVAKAVTQMMTSPRFLYHVESGTKAAGAPDIFALDAWELAARLSYHFWGTTPDPKLREAARSGAILTDEGYAREVERLFADARATATFGTFFTQWFWPLLELPPLDSRLDDARFKAFAGANLPSSELRGRMVREVVDAATYIASHGGKVSDLLTNRQSFARDADLAAIYKVAPWNGTDAPPEMPAERAGLLTRAAFLATGSANTRPIMKGVFIRTTLLCTEIPPPPPAGMMTSIELSPTASTRQVVEEITEKNVGCAGCHQKLINPLGFASENFDALGRVRTSQTLFDPDGKVVGQAKIDTTGVPRITPEDTRTARGIGDVTQWLVESGRVEDCFARRYFRFSYRRVESTTGDQALIDVFAKAAKEGRTLSDILKATAQRPEFKRRRFFQ